MKVFRKKIIHDNYDSNHDSIHVFDIFIIFSSPQDLLGHYWLSDLYCPIYAIGHCFTYNPPEDGLPRFDGGIGLFLGHKDKDHADLTQHQIYLHERGQFWPNDNIPSLYRRKQRLGLETQIYFQTIRYSNIQSKDYVCTEDNTFSMTQCLQQYVVSQTGCAIDWFRETNIPNCRSIEEWEKVQTTLNWLFDASYDELINATGCIQKCSFIKYEIVKVNEQKITWNTTKWLSEFYVYTDSDNLQER